MKNNFADQIFFKIIISLVLALGAYLLWQLGQAVFYQGQYSIDFAAKNFRNQSLPFYVDENRQSFKFASFGQAGGKTYAQIQQTPLHFVFQPPEFPLNKRITVSVLWQTDEDWDISFVCPACPAKQKYHWQPFYKASLKANNYVLAVFLDGFYVYARRGQKWQKARTIKEWLKKNTSAKQSISVVAGQKLKFSAANLSYKLTPKADFVITDFYFKPQGAWLKVEKNLKLPADIIKNAKKINLALRNVSLNKRAAAKEKILILGFKPIAQINIGNEQYILFGRQLTLSPINSQADNLAEWLKKNLPPAAKIFNFNPEFFQPKPPLTANFIFVDKIKAADYVLAGQKPFLNFIQSISLRID